MTYMQNLRDALETRQDIESAWLFMEHNPREMLSRIPPFSFNWTLKGGIVMRSRIRALEKGGRSFDAALFNSITPISLLGEFRNRVPVLLSIDTTPRLLDRYGDWYKTRGSSRANPIEAAKHNHLKRMYARASYVLPWSEWAKNSLIEDYEIDERRLRVVPPGISLRKWHCRPLSGSVRLNRSDAVRILFVGGEFRRKGGDVLVRISQRPEFRDCEFHFVTKSFVGEHPKNVLVHDNFQANTEELITLYETADIFALPTHGDVHSVAALEAMAMGLPVVITNVGAISEIVRHNESGYVAPANDEDTFSDFLLRLVRHPELRLQFGLRGRRIVEVSYDLERTSETIVELMKDASDRGVARRQ